MQIFSPIVNVSFHIPEAQIHVLWSTNLLNSDIFFWSFLLWVLHLTNHCLIQNHRDLLCFLLRVLIVLALVFRFMIHFELIFIYNVRKGSDFILLHVAIQFFQHSFLKRLFFPYWIVLASLSEFTCP